MSRSPLLAIYAVDLPAVLLLLVATAHRAGLESPGYTRSILIPVEFLLLLGCMGLLLGTSLFALYCLARRQWAAAVNSTLAMLLGVALIVASVWVDSPTLLYMT